MPPHCDSMDGPVVVAARAALESEDIEKILPYVPVEGETELKDAFDLVMKARAQGPESMEVADRFFFETAVRIHRAGEGAPFTGLKPAGLDVGPVIPLAEEAIASNSPQVLIEFFVEGVQAEIAERFEVLQRAAARADEGVPEAREYVEATLGLQVWSHKLYGCMKSSPHEGHHEHA